MTKRNSTTAAAVVRITLATFLRDLTIDFGLFTLFLVAFIVVFTSSSADAAAMNHRSLHRGGSGVADRPNGPQRKDTRVFPSDVWIIHAKPGRDPREIARKLGLDYLHPMPGQRDVYAFRAIEGGNSHHLVSRLATEDPGVLKHERQFMTRKYTRGSGSNNEKRFLAHSPRANRDSWRRSATRWAVSDPLFSSQWHLHKQTAANLNAQKAWNHGYQYRGNGVVVAIVDDGLQHSHPDLTANYRSALSHDYNDNDNDPTPGSRDGHGTSAAGVAAAAADGHVCGIGVCPECGLAGIRLIGGPTSDYTEAMALGHMVDRISVYSCSWGPYDDAKRLEGPGPNTAASIENGALNGRSGLGNIYVWAGGNGAQSGDNGNYDGYANSRFTVAIGALAFDDRRAYYSEPCACLMAVAPSSGSRGRSIVTTDLMGRDGYSSTDCTHKFGGTSAAAPAAAGAFGVLLGKYPALSRRDVLHILAVTSSSSSITGTTGRDGWTRRNARGVMHSHEYGWGLINTNAMLAAAKTWTAVPYERLCSTGKETINLQISDAGYEFSHSTQIPSLPCLNTDGADIDYVEYVTLRVWITHGHRGDVEVTLTDPAGVKSQMSRVHDDSRANYPAGGWLFGSARHWGQQMSGIWAVSVKDGLRNGFGGMLTSFKLNVYGHKTAH